MKNTVLLLLLGAISIQGPDFNGMVSAIDQQVDQKVDLKAKEGEKAVAAESTKVEGKSLSEALAGTHIDLSSMQKLLGKEKMKDGEDDEEEEESEESNKEDSKSEDKKEDTSEEDSSKSEEKEGEKDGRLNGRDKNGMYKNHKSYVNLRNKINEQESGHQKMFDSINDKLSDRNFIQAAIDTATNSEAKGPYDRSNNPFEQFRQHEAERRTHTTTTTTTTSHSSSSSSRTSYSHSSSSSSSFSSSFGDGDNDEEDSVPAGHINPTPSTEKPDLFESEFEDPANSTNSTDGEDGAPKVPKIKNLHKGKNGHSDVGIIGGAHTGRKPSFTFGPPKHGPAKPEEDGAAEEEIPNLMTPEQETCYSNRYHDLDNLTAE